MQHAADKVEAHAGRRFGASTAAHRRSGAACDCAVVAHRQLVGRRFRRTHRRAVWRRRGASSNPITTGFGKSWRSNSNCFPTSFAIKERHARGIAARPIEARDHAELDRIGGGNEDDRNRLRCRQSRQCGSGRECSDHGRRQAYALGFPLVQPAAEGPASRWGRPELVSIEASVLAAAIVKKRPLSTEGGL
jgi:hypothetical protein